MTRVIFTIIIFMTSFLLSAQEGFVQVVDTHFEINGVPYHYLGANFWQAMNLASKGKGGNREQFIKELDKLKSIGVTNLRIMAGSEGPNTEPYRIVPALQVSPGKYDQRLLDGLDFVLAEMGKRNMKAVMCLNNFWPWSGGMAQYLRWAEKSDSIPYPPPHEGGSWDKYQKFTAQFYSNKKAMNIFKKHIKYIVNRTNRYTNKKYSDDAVIMAWELANEPRGVNNSEKYYKWIQKTSTLIKEIDTNHLVTIGSEGYTSDPKGSGNSFKRDHRLSSIDYCCTHIWIQNFSWFNPQKPEKTYFSALNKAFNYLQKHIEEAKSIHKPLVLEEFGCARDSGSYDPNSLVTFRNHYFHQLFEQVYQNKEVVGGVNFWAWSGNQKPKAPYGLLWRKNDPITGDPPHELQGWYSVYDTDYSTIAIIKEYAQKMKELKK